MTRDIWVTFQFVCPLHKYLCFVAKRKDRLLCSDRHSSIQRGGIGLALLGRAELNGTHTIPVQA